MGVTAAGQIPFGLTMSALALLPLILGGSGLWVRWGPFGGGVAVGIGITVMMWELSTLVRLPRLAGGVFAAVAAAVVVLFSEGLLPVDVAGVVVGSLLGLGLSASFRYAEHVLDGGAPVSAARAFAHRFAIPWRDAFLALGGHPLQDDAVPVPVPVAQRRRVH